MGAIGEAQAVLRLGARGRTRTKVDTALVLGLLSAGACSASAAQAQDMPAGDTAISVQKRPRPDFDAVPIRFGAFEVSPAAETRLSFDDNIYATRADKVDDALVTLAGSLSAHSTWSRHAASLDADAALTRGLSQRAEDTQTYAVQAGGRLDLGVATQVSAHAGYSRAYEPRGSVGDTTLRGRRIAYNALDLGVDVQHTAGRLVLAAEGTLESFRYAPYRAAGAQISERDRNYRTWSATARAGYAIGPGVALFVEGGYNQARYPDETTALDRSSNGWSARGGLQFGLTRLIRGRAAIGYQNQAYDDAAFPRIKGLDFSAALEWNPTRLVTWTIEARRAIQRSPLVGVAGIRQSRYATRVDYELRRNVILSTRVDYTVSEYAGTARRQNDVSGGLGADWLLTRKLRVGAQAGFQRTRSDGRLATGAGREFDRRRAAISVRYAL